MRTFLKSSNQRGAVVVEFAILLPLLVLLFAGIVEFSLLLYNQQVITNASREAARAAINPLPKRPMTYITSVANTYVGSKLITFGGNSSLDSIVCKIDGVISNDCARDFDDEDNVTIEVKYTYSFLMPQVIKLGTAKELHAATTMRMM